MRVLVTGHEGDIGSVLAPTLPGIGHYVVGLDAGFFADCAVAPVDRIPGMQRDLREVTPADVEGFDSIVHLASLSNYPLGHIDPELTCQINFTGSLRLAFAANEAHVQRFLFASSCSLYGTGGDRAADETTTPEPRLESRSAHGRHVHPSPSARAVVARPQIASDLKWIAPESTAHAAQR
jgi:nucleoside-diphosphate-sugar epimerase